MNYRRFVFWLVFAFYWCDGRGDEIEHVVNENKYRGGLKSTYSMLTESITQAVNNENLHETCSSDDFACLAIASNDKLGLEAIKALHQQLDDDANGNIDLSETGDFLREDLKIDSGYEKRQKAFHYNDDMHISVRELWEAWLRSEVHNWTVEQTTDWLTTCVELPQYADNFIKHRVMGANLPRLAVNNLHYLSALGIKDPIHKQKISLKAMDVVLFGPPKEGHHHWKDLTLVTLIFMGTIGLWYAYSQNKKFKRHLNRMNHDMEGLQNAEKTLEDLQKQLEQAKLAQENVTIEKEDLLKHNSYSDLEVSQLKAEIEMLRTELQIAEGELKDRCWSAPPGLQQWLQLTHEIENKSYVKKKIGAEKQLQQARESCEKLRKKRSSLVGAFVSTHGKSIDDVDRSIVEARTSLNEVTQDLQERVHRWKQIEMLCGFNIINNNGLQSLENTLYRNINGRAFGLRGRMSSQDDLDDETSSIYTPSAGPLDSLQSHWKEVDSSGSEGSKHEDEIGDSGKHIVQFQVGGEVANWASDEPKSSTRRTPPSARSISNNNILVSNPKPPAPCPRSSSQDTSLSDHSIKHTRISYSDSSLEVSGSKPKPVLTKTIREQSTITTEDDVYSTDSSVVDDDGKKKKRKLFAFGKKSKPKE